MSTKEEEQNIESKLTDILKSVADVKNIERYELQPDVEVQMGDGFVSHFYKGDIINKDNGETIAVAIKMSPSWQMDYSTIYKNEAIFYSKFIPALEELQREHNISPLLFDNTAEFFTYGLEKNSEFIALEHLKKKGYVLHDKKEYLNQEQLEYLFKLYGRFHGLSFGLRKQNYEKYQEIRNEYTDQFDLFIKDNDSLKMMISTLQAVIDALDPKSEAYQLAKDIPPNMKATHIAYTCYKGDYKCLTHGDCWSNNMLFKFSDSGELENVKLIDFQLTRESTPIHDLSYFFYASASKKDIDNLEQYLALYHESFSDILRQLGENANEIFPFDVLIKEWKENALLGIILGIYLWQIKLIQKAEFVEILQQFSDTQVDQTETYSAFLEVLSKVYTNKDFLERTTNILIHAVEYGILTKDKIIIEDATTTE
ncbi:hypothetical protein ABEB36_005919 [Hypothenemus hampei]|uniref:CHK kinase-like domain-containing protein n=1 Tax=Hypothenemus hampei TaxID=57062 RepID=A0ABD1EZW7_HYPHA